MNAKQSYHNLNEITEKATKGEDVVVLPGLHHPNMIKDHGSISGQAQIGFLHTDDRRVMGGAKAVPYTQCPRCHSVSDVILHRAFLAPERVQVVAYRMRNIYQEGVRRLVFRCGHCSGMSWLSTLDRWALDIGDDEWL